MIKQQKHCRRSTGIVLLDIEKAFDTVWHNGLVHKMMLFNFPIYITKLIKSFLTNRTFQVKLKNEESTERMIPAGVPQGSVLSPTLYSIYLSDFKKSTNTEIAFYADDTALITNGKSTNTILKKLSKGLQDINRYYFKWKIKLNPTKTQIIVFPFNLSPKRKATIDFIFDGENIPISNCIKYLGAHLDKKLLFRKHIDEACIKSLNRMRMVYPLINKKSSLNVKNKMMIYNMCIKPVLTYAAPVWRNVAKTHIKKLQTIQNKVLKIIKGYSRRYSTIRLHQETKQKLLKEVIEIMSQAFDNRCINSNYPLIRDLIRQN